MSDKYDAIKEVGKIAYEALLHSKTLVKEGVKLLDVAEQLEMYIIKKGYELAFPVNISINQNAAHYTPIIKDETRFSIDNLVKIDIGARKDRYLTDCAITIDLSNKYASLVEASEEALEAALSTVKSGVHVREIGKEIAKIAEKHGFKPIRNLGGHGISEEDLHADVFIPNYDNGDETALEEGEVVAIEPFFTTNNGEGQVGDGDFLEIFQKTRDVNPRSREAREILAVVDKKYSTYPFAVRWLDKELSDFGEFKIRRGINELLSLEALEAFPVLVEKGGQVVAQSEKQLIVEKDSCTVVTK